MFGGHHLAFNITFSGDAFSPAPFHVAAEPKGEFTLDGATYAPVAINGDTMFSLHDALDSTQKTTAYLSGQSFGDVVVGPSLDYNLGTARTSDTAFPAGSNRKGVLVSSMTTAQQALVLDAIEAWVRKYPAEIADQLMTDYTATEALADTYFAWGGNASGLLPHRWPALVDRARRAGWHRDSQRDPLPHRLPRQGTRLRRRLLSVAPSRAPLWALVLATRGG
jgi:hypothetical protein